MICKDNMASLDYKSKKKYCKTHFSFLFIYLFIIFLKRITKKTYHEMHEWYAMQILKKKKQQQRQQRRMVTKSREMKHKN